MHQDASFSYENANSLLHIVRKVTLIFFSLSGAFYDAKICQKNAFAAGALPYTLLTTLPRLSSRQGMGTKAV